MGDRGTMDAIRHDTAPDDGGSDEPTPPWLACTGSTAGVVTTEERSLPTAADAAAAAGTSFVPSPDSQMSATILAEAVPPGAAATDACSPPLDTVDDAPLMVAAALAAPSPTDVDDPAAPAAAAAALLSAASSSPDPAASSNSSAPPPSVAAAAPPPDFRLERRLRAFFGDAPATSVAAVAAVVCSAGVTKADERSRGERLSPTAAAATVDAAAALSLAPTAAPPSMRLPPLAECALPFCAALPPRLPLPPPADAAAAGGFDDVAPCAGLRAADRSGNSAADATLGAPATGTSVDDDVDADGAADEELDDLPPRRPQGDDMMAGQDVERAVGNCRATLFCVRTWLHEPLWAASPVRPCQRRVLRECTASQSAVQWSATAGSLDRCSCPRRAASERDQHRPGAALGPHPLTVVGAPRQRRRSEQRRSTSHEREGRDAQWLVTAATAQRWAAVGQWRAARVRRG